MTGKEILDPGWRVVREDAKSKKEEGDDEKKDEDEERTLPTFVKGESGEHKPTLTEKWTTPPPYYNEASLLRAMETAGKFICGGRDTACSHEGKRYRTSFKSCQHH